METTGIISSTGVVKANRTLIAPSIVSAVVENAAPDKVIITFDRELDSDSIPDLSCFSLTGKTISSAEISGVTLTITVTVAFLYSDDITVNYSKSVGSKLQELNGGTRVASFSYLATNNIENEIIDSFTDANNTLLSDHIMDEGAGWSAASTWTIQSNQISQSAQTGWIMAVTEAGKSDVDMSVDITMPNWMPYLGGLVLRYLNTTNYIACVIDREYTVVSIPKILLLINGTVVASVAYTHENNITKKLRVVAKKNYIKIYWGTNETPVIDYWTPLNNTRTKCGLLSGNADANYHTPIMDNFYIK